MGEVLFHRRDAPISSLGCRRGRTSLLVVATRSESHHPVDAVLAVLAVGVEEGLCGDPETQ